MSKKDNYEEISIYNEDGTIRDKEDFLEDIGKIYEAAVAALEKEKEKKTVKEKVRKAEKETNCEEDEATNVKELLEKLDNADFSVVDLFSDPEAQVEVPLILDTFDFNFRTILIQDEIDDTLSTEVIRKIRFWNSVDNLDGVVPEDRAPIKIYINTPGGDVQAVFNIISAIKMSKTPVYTITYGCGYSGGFFIGICGHKRYCFMNSSFLFHEGMNIDGGDAHKFLQHVDFYKHQLKKIKELTVNNTKITSDEYEEHKKDDWFFSPAEALHYGIVDEILEEF